ncbi:3-oxoacyl-[acyl-carrier-protein] synthase 2 [Sedimentisphaera cyanobacteriorum]|uniref:3-oxoacyl-[acyl-carrier-protein] synthase 2 n=1 Tax=Sedimentisphaera cyanobacteriorum TaxID=1940790 RepID=A0A1Q2HMG3_9BACT|nr:beta-ketoacyl-[acyl-carrier-protein] synthase family protein [Sedimentisphaera cyanobacteriorum]AQQ08481.1 3-oxoacyl-[acyl-carrier-protein] synthase 2 [Sedimentisphaera cyanobacteriorum]
MRKRIVITGLGLVSPMGCGAEKVWKAILNGEDGFNYITRFDASTFPTTFAAEVKDFRLEDYINDTRSHKDALNPTQFALAAAAQACSQAGIEIEDAADNSSLDRSRLGIYMGSGEGPIDHETFFSAIAGSASENGREIDWQKWTKITDQMMLAPREIEQQPNIPAGHISLMTRARGPVRSCLTACAASSQAIGEASLMLRRGRADIMLAGGSHSMIHPLGVTGFNKLTALSERNDDIHTASRPFTKNRDGFIIGEGSAVLVLETLESAKARGAEILAEIAGYGSSCDAFRVTDMHEDARGGSSAIEQALKDANTSKEQIQYINAHGTSTGENDRIETKAIKNVFGELAYKIPVSSVKSMLGHLIGSAGAAELITCVMALRDGIIPQTANYGEPDPELDLDYVPNKPREKQLKCVMSESFGFGGQNDVLVLKKFE